VISPDFVEQFIASDHSFGILHHEFQGFEFLGGQGNGLALADDFHFREVNENLTEREFLCDRWPRCSP
jgi:hypothetical protein